MLRCGWTVERVRHDYGLDLIMRTYSGNGAIQSGSVWFQLKATQHLPTLRDNGTIPIRVEWGDLLLWLNEPMPVVLVVYDAMEDKAYWLHVQEYFRERSWAARTGMTNTISLRVPIVNVLDEAAVRLFARFRDECLLRSVRSKRT